MKAFPRAFLLVAWLPLQIAADNVTFGGGFNSSWTDADEGWAEHSNRPGFNVGAGYEAEVFPGVFLAPEINLETRGQDSKVDFEPYAIKASLRLLYLQVPLFARVKVPLGTASLDVFAGPSLGFLLSAKSKMEGNGQEETFDVKDDMDPVGLGLEMGAGIEFPTGPIRFFVRPGYYLGLTNAEDDVDQPAFRLRNFKLRAGFVVPLRAAEP